jgi:EAL domain-containing protein (putative c-di-GMP-specific phosphodiesterase class I)
MRVSKLELLLRPGALAVRFQPIMELRGGCAVVSSVESLVHGPHGSTLERADILFDYARLRGSESLLDRACVATVCDAIGELPETLPFAINVHAATISRDQGFLPDLFERLGARGVPLRRLTVEIVEHAPHWADAALLDALDDLRGRGARVALDDIGLGQSNYRMMLDLRPDYFKIDRYFVHGCHDDPNRRAVLESVALLAARFGARVVVEGVERPEDLQTVASLGIRLVQGHIFSRAIAGSEVRTLCQDGPLPWTGQHPLPAFPSGVSLGGPCS